MDKPLRPQWIRKKVPDQVRLHEMKDLLDGLDLHTVCEEAMCPNQGECFMKGTATFLILGDICTRSCAFCGIKKCLHTGLMPPVASEPQRIAAAIKQMGLKHVVITSVTRDDLADGGARHFAQTVTAIRTLAIPVTIELLVPDFQGSSAALLAVIKTRPEIINHNMETVKSLYPRVRPQADYDNSLNLLANIKKTDPGIITKSGIMLGLGEQENEVFQTMRDLADTGCDCLTIGQYLPPSADHFPVSRYIPQNEFDSYAHVGQQMGFKKVLAGTFVRSSFMAEEVFDLIHR